MIDNAPVMTAVTHKDADGDTLGSALALALALEPLGKVVPVLSSPPVPAAWWFLPGIERVNQQAPPTHTPVFIFDSSDASRAGSYEALVTQATMVVNIDHHVSNARFGTINLVWRWLLGTDSTLVDVYSYGGVIWHMMQYSTPFIFLFVVDAFRAAGLRIFGPPQAAARLESSKDYAKAFMARRGIPTLPRWW